MEYHPKYPQPFTLEQAVAFDPEVASDEISRLQNSIAHLKRTQDELKDYTEDPDVRQAVKENETTIASQDERIFMLKLALTHHGISPVHQENPPAAPIRESSTSGHLDVNSTSTGPTNEESRRENDYGVYL